MSDAAEEWKRQLESLGGFIRQQRQLANLSLRQLADIAKVSNPYLSQIERGLHEPSVRVLKAVAEALDISAETLLTQAGLLEGEEDGAGDADSADAEPPITKPPITEAAILADERLSDEQRDALLAVYRSYVAANQQ